MIRNIENSAPKRRLTYTYENILTQVLKLFTIQECFFLLQRKHQLRKMSTKARYAELKFLTYKVAQCKNKEKIFTGIHEKYSISNEWLNAQLIFNKTQSNNSIKYKKTREIAYNGNSARNGLKLYREIIENLTPVECAFLVNKSKKLKKNIPQDRLNEIRNFEAKILQSRFTNIILSKITKQYSKHLDEMQENKNIKKLKAIKVIKPKISKKIAPIVIKSAECVTVYKIEEHVSENKEIPPTPKHNNFPALILPSSDTDNDDELLICPPTPIEQINANAENEATSLITRGYNGDLAFLNKLCDRDVDDVDMVAAATFTATDRQSSPALIFSPPDHEAMSMTPPLISDRDEIYKMKI